MHDERRYKAARKRIRKLKEFYTHIGAYIAVNLMLVFIDLADGSGGLDWFYFPLVAWGAGLLIHAFDVYVLEGWFGAQWEERKMQELMGEKSKRKRTEHLDDYVHDEADEDYTNLDDLVAHATADLSEDERTARRSRG